MIKRDKIHGRIKKSLNKDRFCKVNASQQYCRDETGLLVQRSENFVISPQK